MRVILEDPYERDLFHPGEREAHRRFGVEAEAREMKGTVNDALSAGNARFIASQPFFFLALQGADGAIHTQMLACAQTPLGTYPLVAFGDARCFYFLLNEREGDVLLAQAHGAGCQAGLVFVDFGHRARLRVNGLLRLANGDALPGFQCPDGHRLMEVRVEQVYANCGTRVVRLKAA